MAEEVDSIDVWNQRPTFRQMGGFPMPHNPSAFSGRPLYGDLPGVMEEVEDDEEDIEFRKMLVNFRRQLIPQLEQIIAYFLIPLAGAWIWRQLGMKQPQLPSIPNVSFCKSCRRPVDLEDMPYIKL